jgi:asparagine synthase (glutamine-hydrolysing)
MNELLHARDASALQKTFSACVETSELDERPFMDEVARHTGVDAHYVYPPLEGLFGAMDDLVWHQDEPFGSTSIYAQWHVFKLASEHGVKVMLDGQGADEALGGYHSFFGPRLASLLRSLSWVMLAREIASLERVHGHSALWAVRQAAASLLSGGVVRALRRLSLGTDSVPAWLDLTKLGAEPGNPFSDEDPTWRRTVTRLSKSQLSRTNLPMLLHWEDRNSMAHSVEARVPFLDYRLVEFLLGLPDEFKIKGGVTKRVLREAMRGVVPEAICVRMDKLGFQTPEAVWVRSAPGLFRSALKRAIAAGGGMLLPPAHRVLEDFLSGRQSHPSLLWRLIAFGIWRERFAVQ